MTYNLSPEAIKAKRASGSRYTLARINRAPTLAITATKAVIIPCHYHDARAKWAIWIREHLPQFEWNYRRNHWEAPLSELKEAAEKLLERDSYTYLTPGARLELADYGAKLVEKYGGY